MATSRICSIPDCGNGGKIRRGWCYKHYARWLKHGDPFVARAYREAPAYLREVVLQFAGDECLIWPFRRDKIGYARADIGARNMIVSRFVCTETNGPPPLEGMDASHSCGNGHLGCVNPRHLSWKTHAENMADMVDHGRSTRGTRNINSKITDDDVRRIRRMSGKVSQSRIAAQFNLDQSTVSTIISGKLWSHVE